MPVMSLKRGWELENQKQKKKMPAGMLLMLSISSMGTYDQVVKIYQTTELIT